MQANASPEPVFESDEDRTYFLIRLPVNELVYAELMRLESLIVAKVLLANLQHIGWIEMTLPDKPTSRFQQYRLPAQGRDALEG